MALGGYQELPCGGQKKKSGYADAVYPTLSAEQCTISFYQKYDKPIDTTQNKTYNKMT